MWPPTRERFQPGMPAVGLASRAALSDISWGTWILLLLTSHGQRLGGRQPGLQHRACSHGGSPWGYGPATAGIPASLRLAFPELPVSTCCLLPCTQATPLFCGCFAQNSTRHLLIYGTDSWVQGLYSPGSTEDRSGARKAVLLCSRSTWHRCCQSKEQ